MPHDPVLLAHKQWLGYLQPVGLVVAPHALLAAQAVVPEHVSELQQQIRALTRTPDDPGAAFGPIRDHRALFIELLGWRPSDLIEAPESLAHPLPEYGETLRPTFAVPDPSASPEHPWLLLVQVLPPGTDLDAPPPASAHNWDAPPQAKFERLLRETGVPIGLLCNGETLRLVHAPRGETSGHLSFPVAAMCEVSGRPILGALTMLLGADRLFSEADNRRLPALLTESRKYQNEVSTRLAEQVLGALLELLRGLQAADEATRGQLLGELSRQDPQHIYGGLLTVLLRLVFLLYAEDRGLMPGEPTWAAHYSVTGLYLRLREDAGRHPDTMDQRFGAWAGLLSLFRLVYTGGTHDRLHLPAREGRLFDPDSYPFLEGRTRAGAWQPGERHEAPRVPDGVLWRVLQALLLLDGERLSYRTLDVEQIGSVYESMMGFKLERATGPSVAVKPQHVVVDLSALLSQKPDARAKFLKETAGCDLTGASLAALKAAKTPEDALAALGRKQSPRTPAIVPAGSLYLQPGEERRKSGSHYTPRSLTGPIVRTTLRPILESLGERPTPAQILDLKLCDPAMGSGAFLVEAARQLGEHLRRAWDLHKCTPAIPTDEDPDLHARRLVAQQCLYGVDKNPFAVDLAKLSLWLVTLAKDHPFTFLDHALKHGDSLVGLNKGQIAEFRWDHETRLHGPLFEHFKKQVGKATALRREIHSYGDEQEAAKRSSLKSADDATHEARLIGDAVIHAFFSEDSDKKRNQRREEIFKEVVQPAQKGDPRALNRLEQLRTELRTGDKPLSPFHWEIEFPEVFDRENPGFDCFVGNPPFAGKNTATNSNSLNHLDWLKTIHEHTHGNADLVAQFFRRAFILLRNEGCLGLVATNTISQGDTRGTGLEWLCTHGGEIYNATRRLKWPGAAAVIVSILHIQKGAHQGAKFLDEQKSPRITAFLLTTGGNTVPEPLFANKRLSFKGSVLLGPGFTFDDTNDDASSLEAMHALTARNPRNKERIFPYIGGLEVNSIPTHTPRRFAINFGEMPEDEARKWPDLMHIVESKVKPQRLAQNRESRASSWWLYGEPTPALYRTIAGLTRVLVTSQTSKHRSFTWLTNPMVYDQKLVIFASELSSFFAVLQSRSHGIWEGLLGSTMKDDPVYTPSDCFETFPFPPDWQQDPALEQAGKRYYEFRADLMVRNNEGLTTTYNRFHDPDESSPDILKLRELHAEMDRAVLTAYGWTDLAERATCEFRLDYEDDDAAADDDAPRARAKKKPWRYRWPQDFHDEVLARLLDLNQQRAAEERLAGPTAPSPKSSAKPTKKTTKKTSKRSSRSTGPTQTALLPPDDD
ncbi:MAG: N-6 DNA methylase [Nannocystis sp.]|nr:N-6 DNA methylase [Nannocystis sp.]